MLIYPHGYFLRALFINGFLKNIFKGYFLRGDNTISNYNQSSKQAHDQSTSSLQIIVFTSNNDPDWLEVISLFSLLCVPNYQAIWSWLCMFLLQDLHS